MRPTLRAVSARLIVGHLDPDQGGELLAALDSRARPVTFALAEPEALGALVAVPAGMADGRGESLRWGKLVLETVANETLASARKDACDAIVDGLRVAHRTLGAEGLDLVPRGSSGVGFCAAALVDDRVQLVVVPPSQLFVVHQGVALSVPQSDEVGRGIWMREDLRAEMFAGVGGAHEPDIRVYDAGIVPGDSIVLVSSGLARILTEDEVRQAVAYEEAATGAERIKQLALQRGVDAAVALVVEIAGSFEEPQPEPALSGPIVLGGIPRPRLEMPPVGSIFSTARDWLLEAVDRAQPAARSVSASPAFDDDLDAPSLWPSRPRPGDWRRPASSAMRISVSSPARPLPAAPMSEPGTAPRWPSRARSLRAALAAPVSSARPDHGWTPRPEPSAEATAETPAAFAGRLASQLGSYLQRFTVARRPATADAFGDASSQADGSGARWQTDSGSRADRASRWQTDSGSRTDRASRWQTDAGSAGTAAAAAGRVPSLGWRAMASGPAAAPQRAAGNQVGAVLAGVGGAVAIGAARLRRGVASIDFGARRPLIGPAVAVVFALLVVLLAVRTIKAQQAHQIQQRFDSLVSAAAQLQGQAKIDADHNDAQGLIRRAQALLDQAATLEPNQPRVASVRKDLQADLDRMDSVVTLPQPTVLASFSGAAKDVNLGAIAADGTAFYGLDSGGQRLLQVMRQSSQATVVASKGDKAGPNQLAAPKLLATRDDGALLLDANRTLWSWSAAKPKLEQIGLKSADTWKDATAMAAYGPNLYVLDATLGNIFRYASRDGIFTDAPTRFLDKDNPELLGQGTSLAIDGSIWVATADGQILKLAGASGQPLAVNGLPQPMGKISQIATQAGFSSLYLLNGAGNRVFEIGKDGRYIQQLSLNLPAPAVSIWPDQPNHKLTVLSGSTLYQYQLP